jgi:DNA-directed RNA polymerase specialized sigma24 family protein
MTTSCNQSEAEEVATETIARALSSWSRMRAFNAPWVTRVATNLSRDAMRRRPGAAPDRAPLAVDVDVTDRIMLVNARRAL